MRNFVFLTLALVVALGSAACSSDATNAASEPGQVTRAGDKPVASDGTGTVGAQLTLPAGQLIEVVQWVITGPNGAATAVQSGSVAIPNSRVVSFIASDIPAGAGYLITLSGTAIDGSVTCTGSASFAVQSHETTPVFVALACSVSTAGSQVTLVNGTSFNCANVTNITAIPAETAIGGTIALTAAAAGPVASQLSYAWSAPSGSLNGANAATANFTCTAAGPVSLTLVVADGPVPAGSACNTPASTRTITVLCDALQEDAGMEGGAPDAGMEAGTPDAGADSGAPPPVPALPGSRAVLLGIAMLGFGMLRTRRPQRGVR